MKTSRFVLLASILATILPFQPVQADESQMCGFNSGVWVCDRETKGKMPGNHAYLWDARDGSSCGSSGASSGSGSTDRYERGPAGDNCNFVSLSEGREDDILQFCHKNADNGIWVPYWNDCYNAAKDSVQSSGLPYPGTPNRRLGSTNDSGDSSFWSDDSDSGDSSFWSDGYGYDSDGDGMQDQSMWDW